MNKPTQATTTRIRFKLYPENKFLFAEVNIWPTKKSMYAYKPLSRNYEACCTGITVLNVSGEKSRKTGAFAELNFYLGRLGVGVVSHEITHAAFCWADRIKLPMEEIKETPISSLRSGSTLSIDSVEERFCYALGEMVRQFTQILYDKGVYQATVTTKN